MGNGMGHNRQAVFAEAGDSQYYLDTLKTCKQVPDVKVDPGLLPFV
jgi:hypothetical protein